MLIRALDVRAIIYLNDAEWLVQCLRSQCEGEFLLKCAKACGCVVHFKPLLFFFRSDMDWEVEVDVVNSFRAFCDNNWTIPCK